MPLFSWGFLPKIEIPLFFFIIFGTCICLILAVIFLHSSLLLLPLKDCNPRGCRKLGLTGPSNLADEYHPRYLEGVSSSSSEKDDQESGGQWRVKSLWIYPVKSCQGVELHHTSVVATGLEYDRLFSFARKKSWAVTNDDGVDVPIPVTHGASNQSELGSQAPSSTSTSTATAQWEFITQRQHAVMSQISTEVWVPDPSSPTYSPEEKDVQSGGVIIISFPRPSMERSRGMQIMAKMMAWLRRSQGRISFRVPLQPWLGSHQEYRLERMSIWKDAPLALNMSMHVPQEFQQFLGLHVPVGLFRVAPTHERQVFRCAPRQEELGWQPITGFSDAVCPPIKFNFYHGLSISMIAHRLMIDLVGLQYPIHLQNLASIRDLNRRIVQDIPRLTALRLRPNIISR